MRVLILVCVLLPVPAMAQEKARIFSDLTVWTAIGLDTVHSVRAESKREAFTCQAIRMGVSLAVPELLKRVVHKERPDHSDHKSFPSQHTWMAGQAAGWRYSVGIPVMALTGYWRVKGQKHDWWDVAGGAAGGLLTSRICR